MTEKLLDYFKGDELAANVWLSKYAQEGDETPDDMHKRLAKEFARIEKNYKNSEECTFNFIEIAKAILLSEYGVKRKYLTENSIYNLFKDFKYILPQGSIMSTLGTNTIASLSNCWVVENPLDSYAGIHKTDGDLIFYYKRRGGVGIDISNLRPANTFTNNTAKSSTGAVSFMNRFSNTTREVAMNGRRGALMISMNINHPDIMDFIKIKRDLTQVTGANISIKLSNEFMKAVENDEDYILRWPCNLKLGIDDEDYEQLKYDTLTDYIINLNTEEKGYIKKIKAKEYWDEIIKSAKEYAEPGLMYWDNVLNNDPAAVYKEYEPICSNPCGEQFLNANDSCRLLAINLFSFVINPFTPEAILDYNKIYEVFYEALRLGDNLVDLEIEYIDRIIKKIESDPEPHDIKRQELNLWIQSKEKCFMGRRIGLGITALGDMLAALNLRYDSNESLIVIKEVMAIKMRAELDCTNDLAILRGTFEGWNKNLEFNLTASNELIGQNTFYEMLIRDFPEQAKKIYNYGRRNVSWSTIAPTGSVSILTQTTSGVEPLFMPFYMRRKKINPNEEGVRVDFIDQNGDKWQEFPIVHPKLKDWYNNSECRGENGAYFDSISWTKEGIQKVFELSPWYGSTANDIDWKKRVEIQSILQKYTTNAISSTINLPNTVSYEEVSSIYKYGWLKGLKGQTVYVDGSRSGVLVSDTKKDINIIKYIDAPKRPKSLNAKLHIVNSKGRKFGVIVGFMDDKPYELFAFENPQHDNINGEIIKIKKGHYNFISSKYNIENLQISAEYGEELLLCRWISMLLRHGARPEFIIDQVTKTPLQIDAFGKAITRVLKRYIPDGTRSGLTCSECGGNNIVFEEGCSRCLDCGSSKCS